MGWRRRRRRRSLHCCLSRWDRNLEEKGKERNILRILDEAGKLRRAAQGHGAYLNLVGSEYLLEFEEI